MKSWKKAEYDAAREFDGTRRRQRLYRPQGPDVKCDVVDIEVKQRKVVPKWIYQALQKYSTQKNPTVLLWLQTNQESKEGLIVMSVPNFQLLLKAYRSSLTSQASSSIPKASVS